MRRALLIAPFVFAVGLTACGGTDDSSTEEKTPPPDENSLTFTTGEFEVPAGDSFTCFYTDQYTDRELAVYDAEGYQGPGGHHIVVYWTDDTRDAGYHPCLDSEMTTWHQIAGGSEKSAKAGEGVVALDDGLAIKVPAGKRLVMQAHYINTTGKPETVTDSVKLRLLDPALVKAYVNYFVTLDLGFKLPPATKTTSTTTCTTNRDFDMVTVLGHMHELGRHYKLETIDESGQTLDIIRDDEWLAEYSSHPPVGRYSMAEPYHLAKGTKLRQTCTWDNTTMETATFPREMCLAFFYYFPGTEDLICPMAKEEPTQ